MNHEHDPQPPAPAPGVRSPESADDAGSRALAEALRSSFAIVKFVMWVLVIIFLSSGFFTVGPQEKAVILRFGKPVGTGPKALLGSGLHWSFPYPIDEVVKIPISEIQNVTSTIGWYYVTPEQEVSGTEPPAGPSLNPAVDGYLITADANIIHARVRLYYRIDDPIQYVFGFVDASNAVQDALNNALLYAAARFKVDDILYREVSRFQEEIQRRVALLIDQEQLGVSIDHCQVLDRIPPRQVKAAFDRVTTSRENRNKLLNDAHTHASQVLIAAGAQAASITNRAAAAKTELVKATSGDAKWFTDLLPKYEGNPDLFKQVYLVNAMDQVLTNVDDKIFLPNRLDGKSRELRLLLNREPPKLKSETPASP
jgi:membrane protease subunit HflK